ncbi:MAG: GAK system XXXCH domain-containing protein [Desulfobulbaceae bacterium]|nr:GAK system XXXCH domain-containing protein [Desulfobulbaceae bacterium]MCK5404884.1 GAK system XXXCH domain-containing protein [Desulfobulbaceae bacterium]
MSATFKLIRNDLSSKRPPESGLVQEFLDDAKKMITSPGSGDEYYFDFKEACQTFQEAFETKDISLMEKSCDALGKQKKQCHSRYKK